MQNLITQEGHAIPDIPWNRYPRPQLMRDEWLCLNGMWELNCHGRSGMIRVPFCPESLLSGVPVPPEVGEDLEYRRSFSVPQTWDGKRVLLHFGAVMRRCTITVNGKALFRYDNGYLPFSFDITDALCGGENELCVHVINDLDPRYPWGKQSRKRGGMWYTPCSGIWQSVWLEPVPKDYIQALHITCGRDWVEIHVDGVQDGTVELNGHNYPLADGTAKISFSQPQMWSPENPYLYRFKLLCGDDRVQSYFALRTLSTETVNNIPRLCLNGKPYFFNALLDQGYWSDGLYTPADPGAFERDILAMKSFGFNTLRKHIKIEPEQFYYDCDRLGMIVFQDMVNNGEYRFFRDTALPTARFLRRRDQSLNPDPETRRVFLESMDQTVNLLRNHPCICLWTIFNEGWGQFCADDAYARLKALDNTRFVDSTSGWFHQSKSDVESLHIYFGKLTLGRKKLPQLLSEFGGYVWKIPEHSFNPHNTYGYRIYKTQEAYAKALRELYLSLIPLAKQGLCGAVYTQLSDVEDETNGLYTFDRKVLKTKQDQLSDIAAQLKDAVK